jgi:hypothetical protein
MGDDSKGGRVRLFSKQLAEGNIVSRLHCVSHSGAGLTHDRAVTNSEEPMDQ